MCEVTPAEKLAREYGVEIRDAEAALDAFNGDETKAGVVLHASKHWHVSASTILRFAEQITKP